MNKKQRIIELSKRIEAATTMLQRQIDEIAHLLASGSVRRRNRTLLQGQLEMLQTVVDVLNEERANPRPGVVRWIGAVALAVVTFVAGLPAKGALEEFGAMGSHKIVDAVNAMMAAAEDIDTSPDEIVPIEHSEDEVNAAIAEIRQHYRPASRDDIPWDAEEGRWVAPVVDVWDVVADCLDDRSESLQQVVIGVLLGEEGADWISESWLDSIDE